MVLVESVRILALDERAWSVSSKHLSAVWCDAVLVVVVSLVYKTVFVVQLLVTMASGGGSGCAGSCFLRQVSADSICTVHAGQGAERSRAPHMHAPATS